MVSGPKKPRFSLTGDGIHLLDSILWFDAFHANELSFLSSFLSGSPASGRRYLATEGTVKLYKATGKKLKALVCQYNQSFGLGKLQMELLPAGSCLGAAILNVQLENGVSLLYAPSIQLDQNPTVQRVQIRKCDILIINAMLPHTSRTQKGREEEKLRLLGDVKRSIGSDEPVTIYCNPCPTAQELVSFFSEHDITVHVHPKIHRFNVAYENSGIELGKWIKSSEKNKSLQKVTLLPWPLKPSIRHGKWGPRELLVTDGMEKGVGFFPGEKYELREHINVDEVKRLVDQTRCSEVYFYGPYARSYQKVYSQEGKKVNVLYENNQPTLF